MKVQLHFTLLLFSLVSMFSMSAQTLQSDCSSVTVTSTPGYPTVYFYYVSYTNCQQGSCCRIIQSGNPAPARYYLDRQNANGTWSFVSGPKTTTTFSGLAHGTYRVRIELPAVDLSYCSTNGGIDCYNILGQNLGKWGRWNLTMVTTNSVIVGATIQSDLTWNFVDVNNNGLFNPGEVIKMNTTGTRNYDRYFLAVFENGGQNRYWTKGWTFGTIPNNLINLTAETNGAFSTNGQSFGQIPVSYTVQFAIATGCNAEWTNVDRNFSVCLPGMNCRETTETAPGITIAPNPASTSFHLYNLNPELNQQITVSDMTGRTVKTFESARDTEFDIAELGSGLYIVNVWENNNRVYSTKLSVVK